ncbi:MAG TPA: C4-dicarboxylate ABC transporter, partial [Halomonas sp.]|nr:C4-dicarboxylate ABC transporter [Halomonas sp.]
FAVNQQVWQTLDEEQQTMLRETAREAGEWDIAMTREQESERLAAIQERGDTVTELIDAQYQGFVDATQSVYEKWAPRIGDEVVEAAQTAIDAR